MLEEKQTPHPNHTNPNMTFIKKIFIYDTLILRGNNTHVAVSHVYKHHHDLRSLARRLSFCKLKIIFLSDKNNFYKKNNFSQKKISQTVTTKTQNLERENFPGKFTEKIR